MTPVKQTILDPKRGDCARAVVASLFDLDISQVPHFILFPGQAWWDVYCGFIWSIGWRVLGSGKYPEIDPTKRPFMGLHVDGYVDASVPSKNYPGVYHAVVMDTQGLVVHDPAPDGKNHYQGVNVIETGELDSWIMMEKREVVLPTKVDSTL